MPRRTQYPDEIEIKVDWHVDKNDPNAFNTEDQLDAGREINTKWPSQYQILEEEGDFSRGHYQNVYGKYFGPEGTELTFDEIDEDYGSLEAFLNWQENGARDTEKDRSEIIEHELDIYERGVRFGYKLAKQEQGSPSYLPGQE